MADENKSNSDPAPWKKLKGKLALWLKAYLDESTPATFLNQRQSAKAAKYKAATDGAFSSIGYQNFTKLQPMIDSWMDDFGLTESSLKRQHKKLCLAQETKIITIKGKVEEENLPEGCTIICTATETKVAGGMEPYEYEVENTIVALSMDALVIQQKMVDMGYRVKGLYAADKLEITNLDKLAARLNNAHGRKEG